MHKLIFAIVLLASLNSCYTTELTQLSTKYKPNPVAIIKVVGLSKDKAWERILRLFAERSISIKTIDNSGFIQSNPVSFISAYQIQSESDPPLPPYIITERIMEGGILTQPLFLTGDIRIFLLSDSNQTEIRVNIEDLKIDGKNSQTYSTFNPGEIHYKAISTGKLETEIADYISTGKDSANTIRIQNRQIPNPYYAR